MGFNRRLLSFDLPSKEEIQNEKKDTNRKKSGEGRQQFLMIIHRSGLSKSIFIRVSPASYLHDRHRGAFVNLSCYSFLFRSFLYFSAFILSRFLSDLTAWFFLVRFTAMLAQR